jgi:arylsulfatase A
MITRLDTCIGTLLTRLKDLKIDQRTIIFFTSDNGPHKEAGVSPGFFQSAGSLRGIKGDLYEGGLRVPLLARWPGKIKPGKVIEQSCAAWDLLPTMADIVGVKLPPEVDGLSVSPALLDKKPENHTFLYWAAAGSKQAVRFGEWKAIQPGPDQPLELYNLTTDPGEQQNVASKNPHIVAQAEKYLKEAVSPKAKPSAGTTKDAEKPKKIMRQ